MARRPAPTVDALAFHVRRDAIINRFCPFAVFLVQIEAHRLFLAELRRIRAEPPKGRAVVGGVIARCDGHQDQDEFLQGPTPIG